MVKIYTLTFHRADNYGAILQSYALQKKLLSFGVETKIIDYRGKGIESQYRLFTFNKESSILIQIIDNVKRILRVPQAKKFNSFRKRLLLTTAYTEIPYDSLDCDAIIVGSDQVWNKKSSINDDSYYLVKSPEIIKKYSFAASFGSDCFPEPTTTKQKLERFEKISVRENSAYNYITEVLDLPCEVNIDPVFLRTREEWQSDVSSIKPIHNRPYVLVYQLLYSQKLLDYAKTISKERNYDVIIISRSTHIDKAFIDKSNSGPLEFLWLFNNAETVITNSFHGTAFSIIFQKEFYLDFNEGINTKTRIDSLCEIVGIGNRWINNGSICPLDYRGINKKLKKEIEKAELYLKGICDEVSQTIHQ